MDNNERKEAQDAINKLIQDGLKEAKLEAAKKSNYTTAHDAIETLKEFQELSHRKSANRAMWISIVVAGIGLLFTIFTTFVGTRLTMQDFFNDVKHLQTRVTQIEEELDDIDRIHSNYSVYKYKVDKLMEDFDKLKQKHMINN